MTNLEKIQALQAGELDKVLEGTPYEGATEGTWENDLRPDDDDQTTVNVGVPEFKREDDLGYHWQMWAGVTEMSYDGEKLDAANLVTVTAAKANAAKVEVTKGVLPEAIEKLESIIMCIMSVGISDTESTKRVNEAACIPSEFS